MEDSEMETDATVRVDEIWKRWERNCPPLYRDTDAAQLKKLIPAKIMEQVLTWDRSGKKGIGLIGPTGKGKTRLMFELMRLYVFADERRMTYINASAIGDELAASYGRGAESAEEYLQTLIGASILFIDDLGKGKVTERTESAIYRIIETRMIYQRLLFFTSNCTKDDLLQRFSADGGEPIVRRLREMCEIISL